MLRTASDQLREPPPHPKLSDDLPSDKLERPESGLASRSCRTVWDRLPPLGQAIQSGNGLLGRRRIRFTGLVETTLASEQP